MTEEQPVQGQPSADGDATNQGDDWRSAWITENKIPEIAQKYVHDAFKYSEGQTTKQFQEAAEFRKKWEPYGEIGLDQWEDLGELQSALSIGQALADPEKRQDIIRGLAEWAEVDLAGGEEDFDDFDEPDDDLEGDGTPEADGPPAWAQPMMQWMEQQQAAQMEQQVRESLNQQWSSIEDDLGRKLSDDERTQISEQALTYAKAGDENAVSSAYAAMKAQRLALEKGAFNAKREEPGAADRGPSRPVPPSRRAAASLDEQGKDKLADWYKANVADAA